MFSSQAGFSFYKSGNPPQNASKNPTVNVYHNWKAYKLGFTSLEAQERATIITFSVAILARHIQFHMFHFVQPANLWNKQA